MMELPSQSFADKFSKFKFKFLLILWSLVIIFFSYRTFPFLKSLYDIYQAQTNYYAIKIENDQVIYTLKKSPPLEWVDLKHISKNIQGAIISSEDGKFYHHPGYDLEQLQDAINDFSRKKKKVRGASTITQQLIKNLFLSKEKSFGRKAKELAMAIMLEKHADKNKILETYLNVIEYGDGLYGIGSATQFYFHKKPSEINAREAAFLAMLLPSPKKYSKSFKLKMLTDFAQRSINSILLKMRQGGYIGEAEYNQQLHYKFSWESVQSEQSSQLKMESEEEVDNENDG